MGDGKTPVFQDFYTILAGIENIYIRAKYTSLEGTSSNLYAVRLDYSVANASLSDTPIDNAELCTCPPEYTGTFCEQCAVGYTRDDPSMGPFATCIPCTCNEHSERGCDPDTGVCVECIHNTAGDQCEVCKPGYYGDAEGGTPDDCHPCMCPGPAGENSFSDVCVADSLAEMGFNCQDTCAVGHQGERCETCETGYYGTPEDYTNEGGVCQECFCNLSPQECDSVTGQCSTCWNNTEGLHCEVCKFGFWGTIDNCQACDCDLVGGYGNCSQDTGLCICKPNVEGDRCTECADRSWGFESGDGCTECDCHSIGTLPGHWQCDPATGQCDCKEKAVGLQCDQCMDGYYDIDIECTMCNCNVNGSSEISCDLETGQCYCNKPTIAGRTCDQCGRVGEDSNLFVDEVFTGPWPDCDPCPECFYNWAESIQEVGDQLNEQYAITLDLLENYDNMPVSLVDQIIVDIQGNLSYAEQVLADAADEVRKLSELNKGFEQIQFEVGNFTEILDNIQVKALNVTLGLAQISTFYGNVEVAPGVFKTPTQIQNDLAIPLATQEAYFSSANTSWFHIQELYNSVQGAGTRVQTLTNEVDNLLSIIQVAESEREAADILINNNILLNENIQNTVLLTEIDNIQSEYPVTEVQEKVDQAYSNAVSANISANSAIVYAETRLDEATAKAYSSQIAKYNTTMAETSTLKAQSAALTYKDAATWAYSNMSQYYVDMLDAYSRLQTSQAQTASMQEVSTQILGMTVPGVDGMETLTEQILQTDISEQIVADTLASAEATLNNANSALNVSLEAETEAQGALALVQGIENTLKEAENVRAAAVESLAQTDSNITNVHDVSNEVIAKGALEETKGQAALTMIAQIRLDILHAGQCFDEELSRANTAEAGANQAKANSEEAVESYTVNAAAQSSISGQVDTVLVEKVIEYNEVKTVSDSAKSLMNDITATAMMEDLQALLQQYITQRTEMDMLMAQMQQMEDDLDGLLTNIEGSEGASIQCDE
uniref:Laminin subunit gamma-1-like n=1 Tax=Saccoglossus kowalevskii TaxID=10224 RepID=A0ABM0M1F8_SACKO|nr:PREDICTED: laminin subunit gamma-1-like [Saccoglossus kowalevskii]